MNAAQALELFHAALSVSLPTFGWVVLGLALYRLGWFPEALNTTISRLSFNYGLPVMLFAGAARVDYTGVSSSRYLLAGVLGAVLTLVLAWCYSLLRQHPLRLRGVFVQAAFRSNLAIVGVALAYSAYGERGPALAALPVALMTVLYNILAVWVLNTTHGGETSLRGWLLGILRNPLIIGIGAGIALSLSGLPVPAQLGPAGNLLSAFFLPLVLVCIGGSLTLSKLYRVGLVGWEATLWRLCVGPAVVVSLALAMGVSGEALGVLFLLTASPVAASSYVMVVAARGDGVLAANMIVLSTLCSVVTITAGLFLLSALGLVGNLQ